MKINYDFAGYSKISDVGRWHITRFVKGAAILAPRGALVLDAGAGECVYKRFFEHCRYFGVDAGLGDSTWNYRNLDAITSLYNLPFGNGVFDAVLHTQTLEHLSLPKESLCECYRVLKPGGMLYLSAPMAHMEHQQPYDFFRFTSYGLRLLVEAAGFEHAQIQVGAFGGMFTRWAYELRHAIDIFPNSGLAQGHPNPKGIALLPLKAAAFCATRLIQVALLALDRLDTLQDYPFGWWLIATKAPLNS